MTEIVRPPFHIAVDVGGTFTDLVLRDHGHRTLLFKSLTTPGDLSQGIINGLELMAANVGCELLQLMSACESFACGTTAATNALLEGKTARTALLCTEGFRDVLSIREGGRNGFSIQEKFPEPYISRELTFGIRERVNSEGGVETPLDETNALEALHRCKMTEPEAIAVALLWSPLNPIHELRLAALIEQVFPGLPYSLSHLVNPVIGEYRRTSATAIDASLKPVLKTQIFSLETRLRSAGFKGMPTFVCSNGGRTSSQEITEKPVYLCLSGPSTAPAAACRLAERSGVSHGNIITIDIGGTSLDASIARNGRVAMHREGCIGGHVFGVASIDVATVGSGGGSIAWVDAGGMLHVGPESAGSYPGPACYGRGGERPTLTDANLVRGLLNPHRFADGQFRLTVASSREAIRRFVAEPLGVSVESAAALIAAVAEQDMVAAIEDLAIRRGFDPREFLLVAGGGAGGLHAARIASELGMKQVLIPHAASVLCAYGTATGDVKFDFSISKATTSRSFDYLGVAEAIKNLNIQGEAFLDRMDIAKDRRRLLFTVEAHYQGQVSQLSVDVPDIGIQTDDDLAALVETFHQAHEQTYSIRADGDSVEFIAWNVEAIGLVEETRYSLGEAVIAPIKISSVNSRETQDVKTGHVTRIALYEQSLLNPGNTFTGPALIEDRLTSIFVPPLSRVTVTNECGLMINLG